MNLRLGPLGPFLGSLLGVLAVASIGYGQASSTDLGRRATAGEPPATPGRQSTVGETPASPARQTTAGETPAIEGRPTAPPVEALVRLALERSPSLAAQRARVESAKEQVAPAGALPDPMVGAMYQSAGPPWNPMAPMSMAQLEVSQALPGFGKRLARRRAAEADALMRESDIRVLRARLRTEVRSTYAKLYALDRERDALEAATQLVQVLATGISARYITGQGDQEAMVKAQLEQSAIGERLSDLDAEREALAAQMNRLTAEPEGAEVGYISSLPETALDVSGAARAAASHSPELQAQENAIHAAARRVESAEVDTRPNFQLGVAAGAMTTGDPIVTLRFGMELPLWRSTKQEPLIRAARKDAEAAQYEHADLKLRLREEVAKLVSRWRRDNDQVSRYRDGILPQTVMALDAARAAYAASKTDFTTVIVDFRAWLDAQVNQSKREADRFMTWAEIVGLTGGASEER